jgi:hypothetical protein
MTLNPKQIEEITKNRHDTREIRHDTRPYHIHQIQLMSNPNSTGNTAANYPRWTPTRFLELIFDRNIKNSKLEIINSAILQKFTSAIESTPVSRA